MAFRIVTQVNYSAGNNPEGDSGLYFLSKLLFTLVHYDPDLHFYVLIPKRHQMLWSSQLSHQRITLVPINLEPRLHGGIFMFDPSDLYTAFDFLRYDIDALFLHQPETAPAFLNFLNKQMFNCVPAASYVHWFDTRPPGTPKREMHKPALLGVLSGMLVSNVVGVNSTYGRDQIVEYSRNWFNEKTVQSLSNKLLIMPSGVDQNDITYLPKAGRGKSNKNLCRILVNHRLLNYTGVRSLLTDVFPQVWDVRKDFTVHATNPSKVSLPGTITDKPWLTVETLPKDEYLQMLGKSDLVVAPHKATHWSISTLEAICAGCVPLMNKESFFREMIDPILAEMPVSLQKHIITRWLYHRGSIISRLNGILDNLEEECLIAEEFSRKAITLYSWQSGAASWGKIFTGLEEQIHSTPELTPSMRKIFELLLNKETISKAEILKHLGWRPKQRTLSWTSYRKSLKRFANEDPNNAESIFQLKAAYKNNLVDLLNGPKRIR